MKLCSACLLGVNCKYNGSNNLNQKAVKLSRKEILVPICPESIAGLPIPRIPSEIKKGEGHDVLDGTAAVVSKDGTDLSKLFIEGAYKVLREAQKKGITEAILKQRSPSCGCGQIYDGTFSGKIKNGDGVTTALLKRNGIHVISEDDL